MSSRDFTFRIQKSELGKYSTQGVSLDDELVENYSASTIERAKLLKAKHGSKYSDAYYLDYAKSLTLQDIIGANKEIFKKKLANVAIKDPQWAGYSYEEIIRMENAGYKIPAEVLQWAHAQQQSDVTDYVIVSESVETDDLTSTDDAVGGDELSKLKVKAQQNILKTEKVTKETQVKVEDFNTQAEEAQKIKTAKEDSYKDSLDEVNQMAKEWKELDDKVKNGGKLNFIENLKYNRLGKMLNGENGSIIKELENDSAELNEFLDSLDSLNGDIEQNLQIANDTINSGRDLGNYAKNYYEEQVPYVNTGIVSDGKGPSLDTLYETSPLDLSEIAIKKGGDLEVLENEVSTTLATPENVELSAFAQDYTTLAQQAQEAAKGVNDGESDKKDSESKDDVKTYDVDLKFTASNSKKAAAITALSTMNLMMTQSEVRNDDKSLRKALKKAQADMKKLSKEATSASAKHSENLEKEEEYLSRLDEMQIGASSKASVGADKTAKDGEAEPSQANGDESQAIFEQLEATDKSDKSLKTSTDKALKNGTKSVSKVQNMNNNLIKASQGLAVRNKNAINVATNTMIVGFGTFAKSFATTALGNALYSTGLGLLPDPLTYQSGLALTLAGGSLQEQGRNEFKYGLIAGAIGTAGMIATDVASDAKGEADATLGETKRFMKSNKQAFKEAQVSAGTSESVTVPESSSQTVTSNEGTEPTSEEGAKTGDEPQGETPETTETPTATQGEETLPEGQAQESKQNSSKGGYSVDTEYSSANSVKATITTIKATQEMESDKSGIDAKSGVVETETKKSQNLAKKIQKEVAEAESEHEHNLGSAQNVSQRMAMAKAQMSNASSQDAVVSAQTEVEGLSTELDNTVEKDEQSTAVVDKTISSSVAQLGKFRSNTQNLTKEVSEFDQKISNQLDVSNKTMQVGIGTGGIGVIDLAVGDFMITSGISMMANPLTMQEGIFLVDLGSNFIVKGEQEVVTGGIATVTGTAGIIANALADKSSNDAKSKVDESNEKYKNANISVRSAVKTLSENEGSLADAQPTQDEGETEDLSLVASASTNVNDNTETGDRADRKLSRFNMDSIIESKKRKKKVQAVSASSTNSRN